MVLACQREQEVLLFLDVSPKLHASIISSGSQLTASCLRKIFLQKNCRIFQSQNLEGPKTPKAVLLPSDFLYETLIFQNHHHQRFHRQLVFSKKLFSGKFFEFVFSAGIPIVCGKRTNAILLAHLDIQIQIYSKTIDLVSSIKVVIDTFLCVEGSSLAIT